MLFADELSGNTVWNALIAAAMTVALSAIQVWREGQARRRDEALKKDADLVRESLLKEATAVRTSLATSNLVTADKLDEVKMTLVKKSEVTAQTTHRDLAEVKETLAQNTTLTEETKRLVNGRHDALIARISQLERELVKVSVPIPPDPPPKSDT